MWIFDEEKSMTNEEVVGYVKEVEKMQFVIFLSIY